MSMLALAVGLISTSGCKENASEEETNEEEAEAREATPDQVTLSVEALESLRLTYARAEERELSPSLEVPAEIVAVPDRRATVGPRVAGRVVDVGVNVGDRVERGEALVVLESDEVGRARADLIAARARAAVARRKLDRERGLLEDRITSRRAFEEAEGDQQVAEADLRAARTRLATFGVTPSEPAPRNPARVTLTSPMSGTVVMRSVHVGQWARPSETLVEVVDLDELWLQASVYEREMRFVDVDQPVQVEVRAFPGEVFRGTVAQVAGTLDERTRSIGVRVVLPNPEHRLRPGMFATARIQGNPAHEPRRLLVIPRAALQEVLGHRSVFVKVGNGTFELRRVSTGEREGELVEILDGLSPGDEVVADGSFLLKGQLLRSTLAEEE
jgi:cobalt-zinc-cadmium efflux system membrane fusion protein